jgi:hypothetical protein
MDGSDYHNVALDCSAYLGKDFLGYDIQTNQSVDFQAPKADWDLLFTKYMSIQPNGTPYAVVGVLSNPGIGVTEYHQVDPNYMGWSANPWDETRSPIGWDWKTLNGTSYVVQDSLIYFVRDQIGDVYRLAFVKFSGSAGGGKIVFGKSKISVTGMEQNFNSTGLQLYPNPTSGIVNVQFDTETKGSADIKIIDMLGNVVYSQEVELNSGINQFSLGVNDIRSGMYQVNIRSGLVSITKKLVISK